MGDDIEFLQVVVPEFFKFYKPTRHRPALNKFLHVPDRKLLVGPQVIDGFLSPVFSPYLVACRKVRAVPNSLTARSCLKATWIVSLCGCLTAL